MFTLLKKSFIPVYPYYGYSPCTSLSHWQNLLRQGLVIQWSPPQKTALDDWLVPYREKQISPFKSKSQIPHVVTLKARDVSRVSAFE